MMRMISCAIPFAIFTLMAGEPTAPTQTAGSAYILGPGDQITVRVMNLEEIKDKPVPVDLSGSVRLPVVGRLKISGLTTAQVETEISKRLTNYLVNPDVSVSVAEFRSQPVSVLGAVKKPGVLQVQGRKTLFEILSMAGGLDPDAGYTIKITRQMEWGRIPLASATVEPSGKFSVAEISLKSILDAQHPEENILVKPDDVISVPRAETIYVIGEVQKSGGFALKDSKEEATVLQALSMAGGLSHMARPESAKIIRHVAGEPSRTEIAVNLKKILTGKSPDVRMQPQDILFIPNNTPKNAGLRAIDIAVQIGTGVVIWRR